MLEILYVQMPWPLLMYMNIMHGLMDSILGTRALGLEIQQCLAISFIIDNIV